MAPAISDAARLVLAEGPPTWRTGGDPVLVAQHETLSADPGARRPTERERQAPPPMETPNAPATGFPGAPQGPQPREGVDDVEATVALRLVEAPLLAPRREDGVTRVSVEGWVVEVAVRDQTVDVQIAGQDVLPRELVADLQRELAEGGYVLGDLSFDRNEPPPAPELDPFADPTPARRAAAARAWTRYTVAIA